LANHWVIVIIAKPFAPISNFSKNSNFKFFKKFKFSKKIFLKTLLSNNPSLSTTSPLSLFHFSRSLYLLHHHLSFYRYSHSFFIQSSTSTTTTTLFKPFFQSIPKMSTSSSNIELPTINNNNNNNNKTMMMNEPPTKHYKTDAEHVREFTVEAGQPSPDFPQVMTTGEVDFLAKMMLDEIMEFMATVHEPAEAKATLKRFIDDSKDIALPKYESDTAQIAEQADALVDCYYYSLNAAAKKGVNLSSLFATVHAANMAKRDPETGKFLKRADGKIQKPKGWKEPDIEGEIKRQQTQGAWTVEKEN
jgi:predicted HAD superfamily Cof-like phosphohydrolase